MHSTLTTEYARANYVNVFRYSEKGIIMAKSKGNGVGEDEPVMLNKQEAGELIGATASYVPSMAKKNATLAAGVIADTYPGSNIRRWRISKAACEQYLEELKAGGGARTRTARGLKRYATVEEIAPEQRDQISAFMATIGLPSGLGNVWTRPAKATSAEATNGASDEGDEATSNEYDIAGEQPDEELTTTNTGW